MTHHLQELFTTRRITDPHQLLLLLTNSEIQSFLRFMKSKMSVEDYPLIEDYLHKRKLPEKQHDLFPVFILGMEYYFFQLR